jgi:hypothetical protein
MLIVILVAVGGQASCRTSQFGQRWRRPLNSRIDPAAQPGNGSEGALLAVPHCVASLDRAACKKKGSVGPTTQISSSRLVEDQTGVGLASPV